MEQPIIEINNVKKKYILGNIGTGTLTNDFRSWWAKVLKKEDPNAPLLEEKRRVGDEFMALNGVTFNVNKGEKIGIIGGNGAGKSTLLKILSRITSPTSGEVILRGKITSMLEVGTGFNPEMTGRENIYLNGAILGMTKSEIDNKIDPIIEFSEVSEFIDTPVKRYSSGMYVKLAFSVSAHLDSDVLIMDEVLAVGDAAFQKKCLDKMLQTANEQNRTILFVSHNMPSIKKLCSRCIMLKDGKITFDGDVNTAVNMYLPRYEPKSTISKLSLFKTFEEDPVTPYKLRCKILSSKVLNKESADYIAGEKLDLEFFIQNYDLKEKIMHRWHIYYNDQPILTSFSELFNIENDENTIMHQVLSLDTIHLAPGEYRIDCYIGDFTNNKFLVYSQQVGVAVFNVISNELLCNSTWIHDSWGSCAANRLIVKFDE